jgi:hypothetical protein
MSTSLGLSNRWKFWLDPQEGPKFQTRHDRGEYTLHFSASEVASLFGCGYKSIQYQYQVRTGQREPDRYETLSMIHGREREPIAKDWLRAFFAPLNFTFFPAGTVVHPVFKWLSATPDMIGVIGDWVVPVEIKCPENNVPSDPNQIKDMYLVQTAIQMACLPAPFAILFIYHAEKQSCWLVPRNVHLENHLICHTRDFRSKIRDRAFEGENLRVKRTSEKIRTFQTLMGQVHRNTERLFCNVPQEPE